MYAEKDMISITRLNHTRLMLNSDLIEHIEATPDTVITLTTGEKLMVLEDPDELVERVVEFRRRYQIRPCVTESGACGSESPATR
jgi:flagellar protein FlbD